jgi:NAD(P)H-nitrite reductase large subunit
MHIDAQSKTCSLGSGTTMQADAIVLATGAKPRLLEASIASHRTVLTYSRLSDIDALNVAIHSCKRAAVVGGGLIGAEVAEILSSRGIPTTWFIRESGVYRSHLPEEESEFLTDHVRRRGIDVRTNTVVASDDVLGDADLVVVAIGMEPSMSLAEQAGITCTSGIVVNEKFETSAMGIFAIGDCAQLPWGNSQGWYVGREHGATLAAMLTGQSSEYLPSLYYNSAKFFDVEWQVYGTVPRDDVNTFLWMDLQRPRCLRIAHTTDGSVVGVHALGIRLRQSICNEWIMQGRDEEYVRRNIGDALFDPQLSTRVCL